MQRLRGLENLVCFAEEVKGTWAGCISPSLLQDEGSGWVRTEVGPKKELSLYILLVFSLAGQRC